MAEAQLFYESYRAALWDDVQALGGNKAVGHLLWVELDPDAAGRKLADRVNDGRPDRLRAEQERFIMRRARELRGFSAAMFYLCDEVGLERPRAKDPEDAKAKLHLEFVGAVNLLAQIAHSAGIHYKLPSHLRGVK